jgi:glycosyltransferase domain-containing protein
VTPEEVELLSQLTIVIPTCNRPLALERSIEYWRDLPVTVHILDGSEKPWFSDGLLPQLSNISYHHIPAREDESLMENYERRYIYSISLVRTDFCVSCADDDFFTVSGLLRALHVLRRNDADAAVGICCEYKKFEDDLFVWHLRYTEWREGMESRSQSVSSRLLDQTKVFYLYYAVMKSEVWRKVISEVFRLSYSHDYFHEHLHKAISVANSRVSVDKYVLWVKEAWQLNPNVIGQATRRREADWYRDQVNREEMSKFENHLTASIDSALKSNSEQGSAKFLARMYLKNLKSLKETSVFRKFKSKFLRLIVQSVSFVSPQIRSKVNNHLPRGFREFSGSASMIPEKHLTKNNFFKLDELLSHLDSTPYLYSKTDIHRIESVLLKPREELRLRANI